MAKWQSKAQLEEIENQKATRQVINALTDAVALLVKKWEADGYPEYSGCEHAIGDLIRASSVWQVLPQNQQWYTKASVMNYFMQDIGKVLRRRQDEQKKQAEAAFKASSANRVVVADGMYDSSDNPGSIVIVPIKGNKRILTCLSCEYLPPSYEDNFDGGYRITWAEPTDEEKTTASYLIARRALDAELAYEQEQRRQIEQRRQADLDAIRAEGREPTFIEEFFAGISDN